MKKIEPIVEECEAPEVPAAVGRSCIERHVACCRQRAMTVRKLHATAHPKRAHKRHHAPWMVSEDDEHTCECLL
jgi:hypothetical protein